MKTTAKYNKSEIMKEAWKEFKSNSNWESSFSYILSFSECLKNAWAYAKADTNEDLFKNEDVKAIFNYLNEGVQRDYAWGTFNWEYEASVILAKVAEKSTGFQADVASKALANKRISAKQAWCVAYEYKRVA